jgi:putative FmdB family regulatory protein
MTVYEYRCGADGPFELRRPLGTQPGSAPCPVCGGDAPRAFSAPMLSRAPRALVAAMDRAEKSRDAPEVVTSLPPAPARRRTPMAPPNPALRRLPRP